MSARGITTLNRRHPASRGWAVLGVAGALVAMIGAIAPATPVLASWSSNGSGDAAVRSGTLAPPTDVTAESSGDLTVQIGWSASTGPLPVAYYVERLSEAGIEAGCGTGPDTLLDALGCTDTLASAGNYSYRVVAVHVTWTATSEPSELLTFEDTFLGAAARFSVLGVTATNTGASHLAGDLGVSPDGEVVDFPTESVDGVIHLNDAAAASAASALVRAHGDADARPSVAGSAGGLGGMTFVPGVYSTIGAVSFVGDVTLDAGGDPDALFIFQINGALTAGAGSTIVLTGGATPSNVYWQVDGASDHGANSTFYGTILAFGAITFDANAQLVGRALSQGAVTLDGTVIRFTNDGARAFSNNPIEDVATIEPPVDPEPLPTQPPEQAPAPTIDEDVPSPESRRERAS